MGLVYWILVGLVAGWLAGQVMKGGGYGAVADIILGILGGVVGGWVFGMLGSEMNLSINSRHSLLFEFVKVVVHQNSPAVVGFSVKYDCTWARGYR